MKGIALVFDRGTIVVTLYGVEADVAPVILGAGRNAAISAGDGETRELDDDLG